MRLAVGARAPDVRRQFLFEAAAIGLAGGFAGLALGLAAGEILAAHFAVPVRISVELMAGVTVIATAAGLGFGYLAAYRASSLDPIDVMLSES